MSLPMSSDLTDKFNRLRHKVEAEATLTENAAYPSFFTGSYVITFICIAVKFATFYLHLGLMCCI